MTPSRTATDPQAFLARHEATVSDLERRAREAYWEAATTGAETASRESARLRAAVQKVYSRPEDAARVSAWLEDGVEDRTLRRQLTVVSLAYRGNQLSDEVIDDLAGREAELERTFANFRAELDGERIADNALRRVLRTERDSERRRRAWEASKEIGSEVRDRLLELVRRRNAAARSLGFRDFYQMGLVLQEQEEDALFGILDAFKESSDDAYAELLGRIEAAQSARFDVEPAALRPWHWEDFFCQEAPAFTDVDLDAYFAGLDQVAAAARFLDGIGLNADDILARSDLHEREGKSQHAFCIDVDREGDVRVLCNLRPDEHWTMVLLHELGHAVYDKFIPLDVPWVLREPSHIFTTEAIAMYFGRMTRDARWIRDVVGTPVAEADAAAIRSELRAKMLVSLRWMLVMAHFERALYRDPDRKDLNELWWDLVEEMQGVRRPEGRDAPDWAAKIHLSGAPVYYHNYLLGELMASQLSRYIDARVRDGAGADSIAGDERVGAYLVERVFAPGRTLAWNDLLEHATGEPLNPRHFVDQFVTSDQGGGPDGGGRDRG